MIFTVLSIVGFEVSTVVHKRKNLTTLESIGNRTLMEVEVLREKKNWVKVDSGKLVPGDRLRLKAKQGGLIVPCDCVIVSGSAVVNEASLTGESVPQMKSPVTEEDDKSRALDINGADRVHLLYSGTTLLQVTSDSVGFEGDSAVREGVCEVTVARTGAESSHGELLKMIEASQQEVTGDKRDTFLVLCILLVCAVCASGYVVYERLSGTGNEKIMQMSTYKLILRCVMIVTSVVPPELPMQMALAVNSALLTLQKAAIICTEPSKVPVAGIVTHCLFDKTGTLT
jgi:cation-transporting ATPase 13A1